MIELTEQQRQAVRTEEAPRFIDPETNTAYVLVRAEVYERTGGALPLPVEAPPPETPPGILRSQQAFWRDLPDLLKNPRNRDRWVAYHGDERVGLGNTSTAVYQRCLHRGLPRGEFYVGLVEEREGPPWEPTPLEESLFEVSGEPLPLPASR